MLPPERQKPEDNKNSNQGINNPVQAQKRGLSRRTKIIVWLAAFVVLVAAGWSGYYYWQKQVKKQKAADQQKKLKKVLPSVKTDQSTFVSKSKLVMPPVSAVASTTPENLPEVMKKIAGSRLASALLVEKITYKDGRTGFLLKYADNNSLLQVFSATTKLLASYKDLQILFTGLGNHLSLIDFKQANVDFRLTHELYPNNTGYVIIQSLASANK